MSTMTKKQVEAAVAAGKSLEGADLIEADLTGAILRGADLTGAYLIEADLTEADLTEANLRGADLSRAKLNEAVLIDAVLIEADLTEAYLTEADLTEADLTEADLTGAKLRGADLIEADLTGAKLSGANLRGADLTEANLRGATWDDATKWPEGFTPPSAESQPMRALGRKAAPLLKFRRPETPRSAREFKKAYPAEFESLKALTGGRDFSDALVQQLREQTQSPFEWHVTSKKYASAAQRLCADDNDVLLLNVKIDDRYTPEQQKTLNALREVSKRSGHPVEAKPFFTIGWVRYCVSDAERVWLVEEVQSDVGGVRKGLKDPDFRSRLAAQGLSAEQVDEAVALLMPYAERFYEDALGLIFQLAAEKDYSVEMLDYADKKFHGSPRNVYTDLPKGMGMKLSPGSKVLNTQQTWKITPNRRTSRRPRRTSRKPKRTSRRAR